MDRPNTGEELGTVYASFRLIGLWMDISLGSDESDYIKYPKTLRRFISRNKLPKTTFLPFSHLPPLSSSHPRSSVSLHL